MTAIPSTVILKLSSISNTFGRANDIIKLSDYYADNPNSFTTNITGIPNKGTKLNMSYFYNKSKLITNGLYAQYIGDGPFTLSGTNITQWNDISGNNRHITSYRGTPLKTNISQGLYGTVGSGNFNVVSGTYNDGFKMPFALPQNGIATTSSYTLAYVARYVGDSNTTTYNRRIFDSTAAVPNYLWGFHGGYAGRTYDPTNGWRTETFYKQSDPNYFIIGVETELNSRFNGIDWSINYVRATDNYTIPSKSTTATPTLSINYGNYTGDGTNTSETSNWQIAELIFYNRELTLTERISVEQYLALKYRHFSFKSVIYSLPKYKLLTNNTANYNGWFNVWNGLQYAYLNSSWNGPGKGDFKILGNLGYFGILYANGNKNNTSGYSSRNQYYITYNNYQLVTSSKIHIITCGGGGGGGAGSKGGGGGAAGLCYIVNTTNLNNCNLTLVVGNKGNNGAYFNSRLAGSGGDSSVSWSSNSVNYSMIAYGGYEGQNSGTTNGAGGIYTITNANSGGTTGGGNGGVGIYQSLISQGGAIYTPTAQTFTYTAGSTNLWLIAQAYGAASYNSGNFYGGNTFGNGGSGSGSDGSYARDASEGGCGWILILYDNNV